MLLLPEKVALNIVCDGPEILKGWRRELLLTPLETFLSGQTGIYFEQNSSVLHVK